MDTVSELRKLTQKLHVLYVEDEDSIREKTLVFLNHFFDDVVVAVDGEDGLECFEKGIFDLVITDLKMPKLSGEEMIAEIKAQQPEVVVVVMSGSSGLENKDELKSDFYIVKPVNVKKFVSVMTQIIEQRDI